MSLSGRFRLSEVSMLERCQYEKDVHLGKVSLLERCPSEGVSALEMFLLGESSVLVSVNLRDEYV